MSAYLSMVKKSDVVSVSDLLLSIKGHILSEYDNISDFDSVRVTLSILSHRILYPYHNNVEESVSTIFFPEYMMFLHDRELVDCFDRIMSFQNIVDILPYSLEVLSYTPEMISNSSRDRRNGIITSKKISKGIFYTPFDVVNYMTQVCFSKLSVNGPLTDLKIMDFSCGSGLFLVSCFDKLVSFGLDPVMVLKYNLYGSDIDPYAIEFSKFVLFIRSFPLLLNRCLNCHDYQLMFNEHLYVADSTDHSFLKTLPLFDCIIGNPPYGNLPVRSSNQFIPFIDNVIDYSKESSFSSLIVPLSIAYNSGKDFNRIRDRMMDNGTWFFDNYDRSPDSLFGDDVKTRNTILFFDHSSTNSFFHSTSLQRWTSVGRPAIFDPNKQFCSVNKDYYFDLIPKIGSFFQLSFYKCISELDSLSPISANNSTNDCFFIKDTVYNWLIAYDYPPPASSSHGNFISPPGYNKIFVNDSTLIYPCIAVLNSTWAYLFWTIVGDGFHLTRSTLDPILKIVSILNNEDKDNLGCAAYQLMNPDVITYKVKNNAGIASLSRDISPDNLIVNNIDSIIADVLGLDSEFLTKLYEWYRLHVSCGRD